MRTITLIIVHCSANRQGSTLRMMGHRPSASLSRLEWLRISLRYPDRGTIETGRPLEQVGAHCKNHNRYSIGVCYIGGLANDGKTPMDTRTEAQREALQGLLRELHQRFPKALIVGHRDLDPLKSCPCFNVVSEFSD